MRSFDWPGEDGWPYADTEKELVDPDGWLDDDAMALRASPPRLEGLEPLEREVIVAHYGIDGRAPRTMKELHHELNLSRADLRTALAGGLAKLRTDFLT
jgi:DNA-directed RNA polymerase sigma subunit (sigma70/sigma32)